MDRPTLTGQRNQCPTCAELFKSNAAFDKPRTGRIGVDRRCRTVAAMEEAGMCKNAKGWWITAANPMFSADADDDEAP